MQDINTSTSNNSNILGRRILAYLVDGIIWGIIFGIFSNISGMSHVGGGHANYNLNGLPELIYLILYLFYFVLFEWLVGATLGKLALGIRVRTEQGGRVSFSKSMIRNVLRIVDTFPYVIPNLVGLIVAASSPNKQRVGDRVAHTVVYKK